MHEYNESFGLPWWLSGRESACEARDPGLIPGLERSPGEGNGNPLRYSCHLFLISSSSVRSIIPQKDVLFIIGDWNAKVGSQETPAVTGKFGLGIWNEAGQTNRVLPRKCTGHSKHPLPTT